MLQTFSKSLESEFNLSPNWEDLNILLKPMVSIKLVIQICIHLEVKGSTINNWWDNRYKIRLAKANQYIQSSVGNQVK